ncbi:unnamed protein product [Clonostachys chloroleuca]|uniref:Uncharacterized protein n=1 Tax=Clonostachys chloroleuca TaxID=1926264 RepID=A0AA35M5H3_9HYPO|nr:unnamed protein product [Clonostachys chloroleuca]
MVKVKHDTPLVKSQFVNDVDGRVVVHGPDRAFGYFPWLTWVEVAAEDAIISPILRQLEEAPRVLVAAFVTALQMALPSEAPMINFVKGDHRPVRRLIIVENKAQGIGWHAGRLHVHCLNKPDRQCFGHIGYEPVTCEA